MRPKREPNYIAEGRQAYRDGKELSDNPYMQYGQTDVPAAGNWETGWLYESGQDPRRQARATVTYRLEVADGPPAHFGDMEREDAIRALTWERAHNGRGRLVECTTVVSIIERTLEAER